MGYRSDIKVICQAKAAAEFRKVNKKYDLFTETEGENGEFLFEADYVKWYENSDEYPDVAAYMEVINKYTAMYKGAPSGCGFLYYRRGEDSDDIDYWDNGGVKASVEIVIQVVGFTKKKPKPPTPKVGKEFVCTKTFTHENLGRMLTKGKIYVCSKQEKNGDFQMTGKTVKGGCCCDKEFFKTHFAEKP